MRWFARPDSDTFPGGRPGMPQGHAPHPIGPFPSAPSPTCVHRTKVFERDDFTCVYCGRSPLIDSEVELSVDHVQPRMRGGDHSPGNLVTACTRCNTAKGGRPAWAYLASREDERIRFLARATYVWPRLRAAIEEAAGSRREQNESPPPPGIEGDDG